MIKPCKLRHAAADDHFGEALHFFELRAEREQDHFDARGFELPNALGYLLCRAN